MHERGIAHRDLHYGNIILLSDCTPKIIDIDVNKDVSLARLTTISRQGAINADIDYCRRMILAVFQHSHLQIAIINQLESDLQKDETLSSIRCTVQRIIQEPTGSRQIPRPPTDTLSLTRVTRPRRDIAIGIGRDKLSPNQLVTLAIGGQIKLDEHDKDRLSPHQVVSLAIGGQIVLSQHDKDRLASDQLVTLAIGGQIRLSERDKRRLTADQCTTLQIGGYW